MVRRISQEISIGSVKIGGNSPILVQSMTNTDTCHVEETVAQIRALQNAGCKAVRLAIPNMEAADAIFAIKEQVMVPLIADIHFDYRLALRCVEAGIDKIRINPGNIGDESRVKAVASACKGKNIPIRIGVNSGSVEKEILAKYGGVSAEAMVESALYHASLLEKFDFSDIAISIKASNVPMMVQAYQTMAERTSYPLHLGVTEAGTRDIGIVKSSVGIGALLLQGIGDTIRVSLTADPIEEIAPAYDILRVCGLYKRGVEIISCPTCGRTRVDLIGLAKRVEAATKHIEKPLKIAVMGCAVNGPGEAREADIGIAGGVKEGILFKKGEIIRKIPEENLFEEFMREIEEM